MSVISAPLIKEECHFSNVGFVNPGRHIIIRKHHLSFIDGTYVKTQAIWGDILWVWSSFLCSWMDQNSKYASWRLSCQQTPQIVASAMHLLSLLHQVTAFCSPLLLGEAWQLWNDPHSSFTRKTFLFFIPPIPYISQVCAHMKEASIQKCTKKHTFSHLSHLL